MARHKKKNIVQEEVKHEVNMTDQAVLDTPTDEAQLESLQTEIDMARKELEQTKVEIEERRQELSQKRDISTEEVKLKDKQEKRVEKDAVGKDIIEKQKAFDGIKVTGKFINRRSPGQPVKLCYIKYEDSPVKWYLFEDGKVYTIDRGFADQINEHYYSPRFIQKTEFMNPGEAGSVINEVDVTNKKFSFVPVNF